MPATALRSRHRNPKPRDGALRIADRDIVSFCARQPHLVELAFALADHGHTHVGHVARLSLYTVTDLAGGDRMLAEELQHRFRFAGLDFGLELDAWSPPEGDDIQPMLE
jgi:hypothetical protein